MTSLLVCAKEINGNFCPTSGESGNKDFLVFIDIVGLPRFCSDGSETGKICC